MFNDTRTHGSYPRSASETAQASARKPTAAEYTEKRVSEANSILSGELERLDGQYNRLRAHFGIPPEPTAGQLAGEKTLSDSGMEYQLSQLTQRLSNLSNLVSRMNELI